MTDPRKLGKRGTYRLGRLGAPAAPRGPWPTGHYPSFAPQRRGPAGVWLLAYLAGAALVAVGALAGWWFLPFLAGLAAGLAVRFGRLRLRTALAWLALRDGLPEVAVGRSIAALAGLPASAAAAIAVTLLVAVAQAAVGLWLGRALAPGQG